MTTTIQTTDIAAAAPARPSAADVCAFLSDYAGWLFGVGSTCIRLEKNVERMARRFGMDVELSILPRHLHITVADPSSGVIVTSVKSIYLRRGISFAINTRLSRLSWDVADGKTDFEGARREFDAIVASPAANPWAVAVLASLANASFCRLFGGDAVAMAVVLAATFAGFIIKQMMTERHVDVRVVVTVCSFVSAVLAAADGLFGLGSTPEVAIGTSVRYLVPGIPFINSLCDMLDRHYICALGRLMDAVVLTCCLSVGLCAGMLLMNVGMF